MATSITETERKYEAAPGAGLPDLARLPGVAGTSSPGEQQLEAEYFDTPDLRLLRAGITLRRRRGGSDAGWHLKLPTGTDTRQEIRLPLGQSGRRVPADLASLVRAHTRGEPLGLVARIATRRQPLILLGRSGESLAEVAADDVTAEAPGDPLRVSRWQEVEVELTGGGRRLLDAAGKALRQAGLRPAARAAKLERALDREPRERAGPRKLTPASPAGEVVLAYLREQARTLLSLDPLVRRDEPDSVHQMRVAARRLRSTLRSFGKVLRRGDTERLAAEIKWLGSVLGEARDGEVLSGHVAAALHRTPAELIVGPVEARVQARFAKARASARRHVTAALGSQRYFRLLDELDRLLADPPLTPKAASPAADVLPVAVRSAYRRTRRRMRRASQAPAGQRRDEGLHEARKAAKRARYAAEAASAALGKPARRFAKRMKNVQSALGDYQDTVMARQAERDLGMSAHLAGENAFSYGLLYERDARDGERFQDEGLRAWRRASRPRYRRWLRQ